MKPNEQFPPCRGEELTAALMEMGAFYVRNAAAELALEAMRKVTEIKAVLDDYFSAHPAAGANPRPPEPKETETKPRKKPGPKPKAKSEAHAAEPPPEPKTPEDAEFAAMKKRTFERITSGEYAAGSLASHSGLTLDTVLNAKNAAPLPDTAWRKLAMAVELIDCERRKKDKAS